MDQESVTAKAKDWSSNPCFDLATRTEVSKLLEEQDEKEILERFSGELVFGTGGLRGLVGAGTTRVNRYTVRKATTALCLYMKKFYGENTPLKVAISFDSRLTSKEFSEVVSEVLAFHGIQVFLTKELRPTPLLSFMVRHFKCQAGICLTASHNPPSYNGYKVYWEDGGQVVSPHDQGIIQVYNSLRSYEDLGRLPFVEALSQGLVNYCDDEADRSYLEVQKNLCYQSPRALHHKIVYTPLHGAGVTLLPKLMEERGFENFLLVPEQKEPDGLFPTVTSPNPEEREALALAKSFADKQGASLVLATDPDADRLGVSLKEGEAWVDLNGNQLASLLTHYIFTSLSKSDHSFANSFIVKTTVTTDLLAKMARKYDCDCHETLTGFKWIASVIEKLEKKGQSFLCGGEESLGFLAKSYVRDKDAVSTAALFCEAYAHYLGQGQSLFDVLAQIYEEFGAHAETLETLTLPGREGRQKIEKIMETFRGFKKKSLLGRKVIHFFDYKERIKRSSGGAFVEESFKDFPISDVLSFELEGGFKVMMRPSGTEAKIKFYFFYSKNVEENSTHSARMEQERAEKKLKDFSQEFLAHELEV